MVQRRCQRAGSGEEECTSQCSVSKRPDQGSNMGHLYLHNPDINVVESIQIRNWPDSTGSTKPRHTLTWIKAEHRLQIKPGVFWFAWHWHIYIVGSELRNQIWYWDYNMHTYIQSDLKAAQTKYLCLQGPDIRKWWPELSTVQTGDAPGTCFSVCHCLLYLIVWKGNWSKNSILQYLTVQMTFNTSWLKGRIEFAIWEVAITVWCTNRLSYWILYRKT